jgi:hypothetical protein
MTPLVVSLRVLGTVITHLGAWYRKPLLLPLGLGLVMLGWLRGVIWPGAGGESKGGSRDTPLGTRLSQDCTVLANHSIQK